MAPGPVARYLRRRPARAPDPYVRGVSRILALPVTVLVVALLAIGCTGATPTTRLRMSGHGDAGRPTVRKLDPDLRAAVEEARAAARADGVTIEITSGWRSRAHQARLFEDAVRKYGSEEEARRYVSPPDTSAHVTGDAVDIGPTSADEWLSRNGAAYGLCQVFANEVWHFELATTPGGRCPPMYPDSSYRN